VSCSDYTAQSKHAVVYLFFPTSLQPKYFREADGFWLHRKFGRVHSHRGEGGAVG
jgi:hypothetical protein